MLKAREYWNLICAAGMMFVMIFQAPGVQVTQAGSQERMLARQKDPEGNIIWFRPAAGVEEGRDLAAELAPDAALSLFPNWVAQTGQGGEEFGHAAAGAGDLNGDGFDDVVVGAPLYSGGVPKEGGALVYYGNPQGPNLEPDWIGVSGVKGARFGGSLGCAGDVNGDGYDDLVVGAERYNGGASAAGAVFLYLGSTDGLGIAPDWVVEGGQKEAQFGYSAAGAGDVDGDGYDDVIAGARFYTHHQTNEGAAYLFRGGPDGPEDTPAWTVFGGQAYASFGSAVGSAGDLNGDGFGDVFVTAPTYEYGQEEEGAVFVYFGSPGGLASEPAWVGEGNQPGAWFGISAAGVGDVDGDGFDDLAVGARAFSKVQDNEGAVFLFRGGADGLAPYRSWEFTSAQENSGLGMLVSAAGDVDGDGYDDLLVGAPYYKDDQPAEGRGYLFLGSPDGLQNYPEWTAEGDKADAWLGFGGGGAGDVNGDGFNDVVLGAPIYRWNDLIVGRAFLYLGQEAGTPGFRFRVFLPLTVTGSP